MEKPNASPAGMSVGMDASGHHAPLVSTCNFNASKTRAAKIARRRRTPSQVRCNHRHDQSVDIRTDDCSDQSVVKGIPMNISCVHYQSVTALDAASPFLNAPLSGIFPPFVLVVKNFLSYNSTDLWEHFQQEEKVSGKETMFVDHAFDIHLPSEYL